MQIQFAPHTEHNVLTSEGPFS